MIQWSVKLPIKSYTNSAAIILYGYMIHRVITYGVIDVASSFILLQYEVFAVDIMHTTNEYNIKCGKELFFLDMPIQYHYICQGKEYLQVVLLW